MYIMKIALVAAAMLAPTLAWTAPKGKANIDVMLHRYKLDSCNGEEVGKEVKLDGDHCKNFKEGGFYSYRYHKKPKHWLWEHHADYRVRWCEIAVWSKPDCQGEYFTMGDFYNGFKICGTPGWEAFSASVDCKIKEHPKWGHE